MTLEYVWKQKRAKKPLKIIRLSWFSEILRIFPIFFSKPRRRKTLEFIVPNLFWWSIGSKLLFLCQKQHFRSWKCWKIGVYADWKKNGSKIKTITGPFSPYFNTDLRIPILSWKKNAPACRRHSGLRRGILGQKVWLLMEFFRTEFIKPQSIHVKWGILMHQEVIERHRDENKPISQCEQTFKTTPIT